MTLKEELKLKPLAYAKWAEIKDYNATHVFGKSPTRIFKTRRPLESTNEYALAYREENFQPITKQSFHLAINAIIETADHVHVGVENLDDSTTTYLEGRPIKVGGKTYTHEEYIIHFVGKMVEYDPNAVLVHLPVHPSEELDPRYDADLPNFNNILTQNIELDIYLVGSEDVVYIDDDILWYYGGEWVWKVEDGKEFTEPYYWVMTKDYTKIIVPRKSKDTFEYFIEDYYANDLERSPFDVIGNNPVIEKIDDQWVKYHESTYAGAIAVANKLLGIDSDNDILQTRYTYPEKFQHVQMCAYPGCHQLNDPDSPYNDLFVTTIYDEVNDCSTNSLCGNCGGKGFVLPDTSPLGTHLISKADLFEADGNFVPPLAYITPPLDAPKHMSEQVDKLFDKMCQALFIIHQNMTNQSGESKSYDVRQKVTVITKAVKNIYSIYKNSLNTVQGFLRGAQDVELVFPPDFNVKTSQDITIELGEARNTSSTYTSELSKELILKKFGNTMANRRAVEFLELYDKLFGFTMDEVLKAKAIYGSDLTSRDQVVHDKGWAVLQKLAMNEGFDMWSDEQLKTEFDSAIDDIMGVEPEDITTDDPFAQLEAEAKSKLKGTVGGVQGIIQINAAVATGQMSEDAAEALLMEIYGFDASTADRLIEPKAGNTDVEPPIEPTSPIA